MPRNVRSVGPIRQGFPLDRPGNRESRTISGHSLRAAAVCIGAGATIALAAIFGQPG